jgi:hypothetical protein
MSETEHTERHGETLGKAESRYLEKTEAGIETFDATSLLSEQHRDYLLQRHGTLDLDPIPSMDPADPYNWPSWKVGGSLLCTPFHLNAGVNMN